VVRRQQQQKWLKAKASLHRQSEDSFHFRILGIPHSNFKVLLHEKLMPPAFLANSVWGQNRNT
jgi:hypothetical protein